ncbi:hypothetical protein Tco_0818465 [Tanacetum coccineum]
MGLWYPKDSGFELTAFSNANHAGCPDTRKSTSEEIQFLGDKLVGWMSKKHDCTAMSTAKAEYVALSASSISYNPVLYFGTKHINVRYYFIKEQVENGTIELYFIKTEYQLTDMFTKALSKERFKYLVRRLGDPFMLSPIITSNYIQESHLPDVVSGPGDLNSPSCFQWYGLGIAEGYPCYDEGMLPQVDMAKAGANARKGGVVRPLKINNSPIFVRYPNLQGNSDIGTTVEYQKALLASLDVPALDKPHIKLETYQEDSFQESNPNDAGIDNAKITRKWSKPDKHGHGNEKSAKEPEGRDQMDEEWARLLEASLQGYK